MADKIGFLKFYLEDTPYGQVEFETGDALEEFLNSVAGELLNEEYLQDVKITNENGDQFKVHWRCEIEKIEEN